MVSALWLLVCSAGALIRPHWQPRRASARLAHKASGDAAQDAMRVVWIVGDAPSPYGASSPEPSPSWRTVAEQLAKRLRSFDARIECEVVDEGHMPVEAHCDVVVALGVVDAAHAESVVQRVKPVALLADDACSSSVRALRFAGAFREDARGLGRLSRDAQVALLPWASTASGARLEQKADMLLARRSSEDACYAVLFALHALVSPVDVVKTDINPSWEKGVFRNVREFKKMADCCGPEIKAALSDPKTKAAIDLLNACDLRDQVGSYRVIVSNETPQLEAFSLCILQQNNCFGSEAKILTEPKVPLATKWRNQNMDEHMARQILIGHLDDPSAAHCSKRQPWSWKVVVGANPAYDAFPAQHQLFYPQTKTGSSALWYDPVFLVETLDGELVWTKRHYRCTPKPHWSGGVGAWTLTTLDNGIVSKEHWEVVDAADDLDWLVVHYSGAAAAAGQSYQGALLCTADGKWPRSAIDGTGLDRVTAAFRACGLEMWELYGHGPPSVNTDTSFMWSPKFLQWAESNPPPLDRIGDQTITQWRKRQRAIDAAKAAAQ